MKVSRNSGHGLGSRRYVNHGVCLTAGVLGRCREGKPGFLTVLARNRPIGEVSLT
jgi:hypothetical protein